MPAVERTRLTAPGELRLSPPGFEPPVRRDEQALAQAGRLLEHLRTQLAELDRREEGLATQLSTIEQERRALRVWSQQFTAEADRRERELRSIEQTLREREQGLDARVAELESRTQSLAKQAGGLATEREEYRTRVDAELAMQRQELVAERERFAAEQRAAHDRLEASTAEARRELEAARAELQLDTERLRTVEADLNQAVAMLQQRVIAFEERRAIETERSHVEIARQRAEGLVDIERREAAVAQSEIDLDKRARFHEDHLQRLRAEVAAQRAELERERQQVRVWSNETAEITRLRLAQVRKFRDLLEQREQAVERDREALAEARQSACAAAENQQATIAQERSEFEQFIAQQAGRIEDRRAELLTEEQSLEQRRHAVVAAEVNLGGRESLLAEQEARLDALRAEWESLDPAAFETSWSAISARFEEAARETLLQLGEQRTALAAELDSADRRRAELVAERQRLQDALAAKAELMAEQQRTAAAGLASRTAAEAEWAADRARWRDERLEAQRVIRTLIEEVEALVSCRAA